MSQSFEINTTHPEAVYIEEGFQQALLDVVDSEKNLNVNLATSISKDLDSIDVAKMSKGSVTPLTFAGAGDSAEINCAGFNSICLQVIGSATVIVKGTMITGGTAYACQDGATAMSAAITTGGCVFFRGIPDYIKINASAACSVNAQPINV